MPQHRNDHGIPQVSSDASSAGSALCCNTPKTFHRPIVGTMGTLDILCFIGCFFKRVQKGLPVYWKPLSLWNRGYLACALAMEALKQYITVKYVRMTDFLLECTVAWDEKRYDKVLQAYARPKLFIIDEWLDIELTKNDLHAIKELVHRRRRKSSTIFCSQILKEGWYQALGGENTEAEAIIDRRS